MSAIRRENLRRFLQRSQRGSIALRGVRELGSAEGQGMKEFGYGEPLEIIYEEDGLERRAVLSFVRPERYGHQFYWDRAAIVLFQYEASARMEKHAKPLALGYVDQRGHLVPIEKPKEFFWLREEVPGRDYYVDLERIRGGDFRPEDEKLTRQLARWLSRVHSHKLDAPALYLRSVRQLIGHSECIWGLIDTYPHPYEPFPPTRFQELEKRLIDWRWGLRKYVHRLAAVHGDFHPWNVIIRPDGDFAVLDRSRGEWGEPADDVASMSCNYLLYGLYQDSRLGGHFETLYLAFWEEYLKESNDEEMLEVIAPFYVFRCLVMAHPDWYPDHPPDVRQGLLRFLVNVLSEKRFDYLNPNKYIE